MKLLKKNVTSQFDKQNVRHVRLTPKGIAAICAVENNLLPKVEGGWDDTNFEKFWEAFEQSLTEEGYVIVLKKQ